MDKSHQFIVPDMTASRAWMNTSELDFGWRCERPIQNITSPKSWSDEGEVEGETRILVELFRDQNPLAFNHPRM